MLNILKTLRCDLGGRLSSDTSVIFKLRHRPSPHDSNLLGSCDDADSDLEVWVGT